MHIAPLAALLGLTLTLSACRGQPARAPDAGPTDVPTEAADAGSTDVGTTALTAPTILPDSACDGCHPDEVDGFRATGMGRSLTPVEKAEKIEAWPSPEVAHAPTGLVYRAWIDEAGAWWQEERLPATGFRRAVRVRWIIGSGNHTRSYLARLPDGGVVQLPLTWYAGRRIWDLSPGYGQAQQPRMDRRVEPACLFCHNDLTPARDDVVGAYARPLAEGISCVRCHGDARAHVAAREAGEGPPAGQPDPTIFNPAHASPARQLQVCQQCHLQGDVSVLHAGHRWDRYDPRHPLDQFMGVFVEAGAAGADFGIASHGRRLARSACAQGARPLTCTTCHDPHRPTKAADYAAACRGCHGEGHEKLCAAADGAKAEADCAGCHMRAGPTSDIPHVRFTDHFIRVRPEDTPSRATPTTELVDLLGAAQSELKALAHGALWERFGQPAHRPVALQTLGAEVADGRARPGTWAAFGRALAAAGDAARATDAFARAAASGYADPVFAVEHANALLNAGRAAEAEAILVARVAKHPGDGAARVRLAELLLRRGDAGGAARQLDAADELRPRDPDLERLRAGLALRAGQLVPAIRHLEAALSRDPLHRASALQLAALRIKQGAPAKARAALDPIVRAAPDLIDARVLRAHAAERAGDPEAALADLAAVNERAPGRVAPWRARVRLLRSLGRRVEAEMVSARARNHHPQDRGLNRPPGQLMKKD